MGRSQPGGLRTDTRARVIVCLPGAEFDVELSEALTAAGYETSAVEAHDEIAGVVDGDEFVIIVLDDTARTWLRQLSDVAARHPDAGIVVLVGADDPETFLAAISAGASGYCLRASPVEGIVRTVDSVRDSGAGVPRRMVAPLVQHVQHGRGHRVRTAGGDIDVTDREWEILNMLMQRRSTREMADLLFVSVGTVRSHVSTLLRKIGAVDREDAIAMIERGSAR